VNPIIRERMIGNCRLIHGDCLAVMPLLGKVDAVVTDPPYLLSDNSPGKAHCFGDSLGKFDSERYKEIVSGVDYAILFNGIQEICKPANGFVFCSNRQISSLMAEAEGRKLATTLLVWHKVNAVPFANGVWRGDAEYIVHFRGKGATFIGNALDKTKVIPHPIVQDTAHPTVKPSAVIERLIRNCSLADQTILDPFMGSGTTLVACAKLGRHGIGIEIDPDYFDIACERVQKAYDQPDMFIEPAPKPVQEAMF
jgi:DNA modification methylase